MYNYTILTVPPAGKGRQVRNIKTLQKKNDPSLSSRINIE